LTEVILLPGENRPPTGADICRYTSSEEIKVASLPLSPPADSYNPAKNWTFAVDGRTRAVHRKVRAVHRKVREVHRKVREVHRKVRAVHRKVRAVHRKVRAVHRKTRMVGRWGS
jgi:hypothetical protein